MVFFMIILSLFLMMFMVRGIFYIYNLFVIYVGFYFLVLILKRYVNN